MVIAAVICVAILLIAVQVKRRFVLRLLAVVDFPEITLNLNVLRAETYLSLERTFAPNSGIVRLPEPPCHPTRHRESLVDRNQERRAATRKSGSIFHLRFRENHRNSFSGWLFRPTSFDLGGQSLRAETEPSAEGSSS